MTPGSRTLTYKKRKWQIGKLFVNDLELMEDSQEYDSHIDNDPKSAWAGQILVTT